MADYRQVHCAFWDDAYVISLTPEEKYFYLYLMTNPKTSQCGAYELPLRVAEFQTGYNSDTVLKLIHKFREYGKILYDFGTQEVCLLNWMRHNWIDSLKVISRVLSDAKSIKSKEISNHIDTVLIGYGYGIDTVPEEENRIEEKRREEKRREEKEKEKEKNGHFVTPSLGDIKAYCQERKNGIDPEKFLNYYESVGWMRGKNKIKNWKACVITWEKTNPQPKKKDLFVGAK